MSASLARTAMTATMAFALAGSGASAMQTAPAPIRSFSFEESDVAGGERPAHWGTQTFGGRAEFDYVEEGRGGGRCVAISSTRGADAGWTLRLPVRPFARYRLSGWIKTEGLETTGGMGALFNLHGLGQTRTAAVTGTQDWTRVEIEFDTDENDAIQVNALFGGWGQARGRALWDDVELQLIEAREIQPRVVIDAAQTRDPISPYIYGQFIEHLGRCIYGGIWAEMLEDRKFYYAVGARESPWRAVGDAGAVSMVEEDSYVGDRTPRVRSTGAQGIVQGELALIEGKRYEGRVVLAGDASAAPIEVSLIWGNGANERQTARIESLGAEYVKTPIAFTAGDSTETARLEIVARGAGELRVGTVSLMPSDNVNGMRPDTLALLKELDSPVYRWPGGNFVSGYDWKDGLGDPDRRPPRKNPAWRGVEHNDFGLHEFIAFCREIDTEPFICVNTGLGTIEMAVQEVEYANGAADTPMGRLRAANGSPEPFGVKWWAIGNEMYGNWQLGNVPLNQYVERHNAFVDAMRAIDPAIQSIAVGNVGRWSRTMMAEASDRMELISEHFYVQENPSVMGHVGLARRQVRRIAQAHRDYREQIPGLAEKNIRIALDEWNYWYGPHVYGELGTRYFLKDALGIAAGLHEYYRNSDIIYMANYAQTVNVIGAIKTTKTAAGFAATGQVLKLYRNRYGTIPVEVGGSPEPLDVAAAWTEDRRALTVAVVNPMSETVELPITFEGAAIAGSGRRWIVTGPDAMAYNVPGEPYKIDIVEEAVGGVSDRLSIPRLSAVLYELPVRAPR